MNVADLIDLEAQLAHDRDAPAPELAARDRRLLGGAHVDPRRRGDLIRRWLRALREAEPEPGALHPGRTVARTLRAVRLVLAALGLLAGWAAATALLTYTGGHPVNVWDVLLALVGVQVLLLAGLALALLFPLATLGAPLLGLFRDMVGWLYARLAARGATGARADAWRALWHRLRSRRSLYHHVEPWLLLATTQLFAVAFNIGALLGCLRLVVFSDVAFGWSTTLVELDASRFHAFVSAVARPWGWLAPDAVPTPALVEATRYSRLEGAYLRAGSGRAADPALVGGWWRFLLAAIACYGLFPRVAALVVAQLRTARLLRRLPLDDAEVARLVARLSEPNVETRGDAAELPEPVTAAPVPLAETADPGSRCALVLWRDVPARPDLRDAVARHVRREVQSVHGAGGGEDDPGGARLAAELDAADPVVVVAEAFEAPDRATVRFVRSLREALGPRRHLVVLVVDLGADAVRGAAEPDLRVWRDGLARLEDPYLAVEPLGGAP